MAQKDIVDFPRIFLVLGSGAILTVATIAAVEGLYWWGAARDFTRKNSSVPREIHALRESQLEVLSGPYAAVDASKTRFKLPIDRAMQLVVEEHSKPR